MELLEETDAAEIHRVVLGPLDTNTYLIRCAGTGKSILVDAADEGPFLASLCEAMNVTLVVQTHGHWDHTQAVPALRSGGIAVAVAEGDAAMLEGNYDHLLEDGETLEVGDIRLEVLHTPGHTPGSTCFWLPEAGVIFSGDTLFPGGPGKTSGPGGDFETIMASLERRIFPLAPDALVLPGHGPATTLAEERPHLPAWRARGW